MKLIINPHYENDAYIGDWERVAFYALAAYFRERLLADPGEVHFTIEAGTLKRLINFTEIEESGYTNRHKSKFAYNDDHRMDAVLDQLFDLIAHSLNLPLEFQSKRFLPFAGVGISVDLKTYSIELSGDFRRLILEHYTLLIHHDWIKAGLTDPGALEIFETIKNSLDESMVIPIDETEEVTDVIVTYTPGIHEINEKAFYRLSMKPTSEDGIIAGLYIFHSNEKVA